jgi:UDP-N-acetylglucosamine 2-epimerase (non-hydrolysing)
MKIASVVGARPNIIKLAPIHKVIGTFSDHHVIIHTGQHYDYKLSEIFFKEFDLPKPNFDLNVGSATPGFQIGEMVKRLEKIFLKHNDFDLVLVYGDTNSTFAGALSAIKSGIQIAHVESGLRSFDRRMPEEINRVLTDHLSNYLFAPTQTAIKNLKREHVSGKIVYSGDIAVEIINYALQFSSKSLILEDLRLQRKAYVLFTMHRAENTDSHESLISIIRAFETLSEVEIVFPIHPRTANLLNKRNLYSRLEKCKNVKLIQPVNYIDFIKLMQNAKKVITDSGGVQKEAYLLSIPCITIRGNTEWIETVKSGWNVLTDTNTKKIVRATRNWMPTGEQIKPIFGDGNTSTIIKNSIMSLMSYEKVGR